MIFKVFKDGKDTGVRIANKNNETAIRDLDRHISKLGADELDNNLEIDFGIDIRETRKILIEIKKHARQRDDKKIAEEYGFPYK